jgi:hypothetical protein
VPAQLRSDAAQCFFRRNASIESNLDFLVGGAAGGGVTACVAAACDTAFEVTFVPLVGGAAGAGVIVGGCTVEVGVGVGVLATVLVVTALALTLNESA